MKLFSRKLILALPLIAMATPALAATDADFKAAYAAADAASTGAAIAISGNTKITVRENSFMAALPGRRSAARC